MPSSIPTIPVVPLPPDACRHAYVALTEDIASIRVIWSNFRAPSSCEICKKDFSEEDQLIYNLETAIPSHAHCLSSARRGPPPAGRLFVTDNFRCVRCLACKGRVPDEWTAKLLPDHSAGSVEVHRDGSEWDLLLAGRADIGEQSIWRTAAQIEQSLDSLHAQAFTTRARAINASGSIERPYVLPVARLPNLANPNNNAVFNFGNNNVNPPVPPRSAAGKKYNRSKLKLALAVGDTVQARVQRLNAPPPPAFGGAPPAFGGFGAPAAGGGGFAFGGGGGGGFGGGGFGGGGFGGGGFGGGGFGGGGGLFGANNNNNNNFLQQLNNATHLDWK